MRSAAGLVLLACSAAWAQSASPPPISSPALEQLKECAAKRTTSACGVAKKELKQAQREFHRGLTLQKNGKTDEALDAFESAARLVPRNLEYATAHEVMRQKVVYDHVQRGNTLLLNHEDKQAAAEFRAALQVDPGNNFALQRLQQTEAQVPVAPHRVEVVQDSGELRLMLATDKPADFHLRGDTRAIYEAIAKAFGVTARFDESVTARQLHFDIEGADFPAAMRVIGLMSKTFWTPLSDREFLVIADNRQNRAQFERMAMRTFYVPDATTPQELTEVVNLLRTVFDIRFVTPQPGSSTVVARAARPMLDAATALLASLDSSRPQVMLEFQVYEVSHSLMRAFGLDMPLQWQTFTLGAAALQALQQPNVQDLVNQLIASGGINQANTTALSVLLAQLQSQSQNPLLQQPFATFGGGKTLMAIPWPTTTVNFSQNESQVADLEHMTLRASQANPATMLIGSRYPILNSTFSPIYNTPAIAQVIQNNSYIAPFPSFNYEDLGLKVKATPLVQGTDVRLELDIEFKNLSGQALNGVPVIGNRTYTGTIAIRDGEAGVVAGILSHSEQEMLKGIPGIARLPLLGTLTSNHGKQTADTELLVLITPHVIRERETSSPTITIPGD